MENTVDEISMMNELDSIERQISYINNDIYELDIKRKFLEHRANDIRYNLTRRKRACHSV